MLHIAIVDDEQVHRDILSQYIWEWKAKERLDISLETFDSSEAFYFMWCGDQRCDVVFLDIMMEGADGVSLARKLREKGKAITIIFTTGIADYMQEGFEVEALHYLLKPLDKKKVWECLDKCVNRKETEDRSILLPSEEGLVKVEPDRLLYAETQERCCALVCDNERFQVKIGIRELAEKLAGMEEFVFCHRSFLVNLRRISKLGKQDLIMDDGSVVPVSRRHYKEVNDGFIRVTVGDWRP